MLNPLRRNLISLVNQLNNVIKRCKRSKPKRAFLGFDDGGSRFGSMELSNQLESVFKFIDANGDGKISPLELSQFLLCLGHDKSRVQEEAQCMLTHLDSNGDGFVDLKEYISALLIDDHDDHDEGYDGNLEDDLMEAFHVFDCDKNGLISSSDLRNVLKRLGFVNCSLKECNLMIKGVDKDGDGFVNFDEFRLMMMYDYV